MSGWRIPFRYAHFDQFPWLAEARHVEWLSSTELAECAQFRDTRRRHAWLVGRLLGKQLIFDRFREQVNNPLAIAIQSRDSQGRAVRPQVHLKGKLQECSLSISHSQRAVLVALCDTPGVSLGVDLADVEPIRPAFLRMWFSAAERDWLEEAGPTHAAAIWAVKEAVYKATNRGEGFAPQRIHIRPLSADRYMCDYYGADLTMHCEIQTREVDGQIAAFAMVVNSVQTGSLCPS